jgi:prophage antirepressor-like protein
MAILKRRIISMVKGSKHSVESRIKSKKSHQEWWNKMREQIGQPQEVYEPIHRTYVPDFVLVPKQEELHYTKEEIMILKAIREEEYKASLPKLLEEPIELVQESVQSNYPAILGVHCYINESGTAMLSLEDSARGLGFTDTSKGNTEYVKWDRVKGYLNDIGFSTEVSNDMFIPENVFYKLAMKASNETARKFQDKVCDEILPQIRKTGGYIPVSANDSEMDILSKAFLIATRTIENKDKIIEEITTERDIVLIDAIHSKEEAYQYKHQAGTFKAKSELFDRLSNSTATYSMKEAANFLGMGQNKFTQFLRDKGVFCKVRQTRIDSKGNPVTYDENNVIQSYLDKGYFTTIIEKIPMGKNMVNIVVPRMTSKGITWFQKVYNK